MSKSLINVWFLVAQTLLFVSESRVVPDTCCVSVVWVSSNLNQDETPRMNVPTRLDSDLTGSEFYQKYASVSREDREEGVVSEVTSGNIPDFLRNLVEVSVSATIHTTTYTLTYFVTPDYLSVGSNSDYFLAPLSPISAQIIADSLGAMLPTRRMVDQIWAAAKLKLEPQSIAPSDSMTSLSVMWIHDRMVFDQQSHYLAESPLGTLVAGHKKDVILSNKIFDHPKAPQVVIYGWHQTDGAPIQPVYNGHAEWYADYSHGIRLVSRKALLNGEHVNLMDLLCDDRLSQLVSDEGPICAEYPIISVK